MNNKILVIVESPSKATKIQEYLGNNYIVMASKGHIADLAKGGKHGLGVDVDNNFKPKYVLMDDKLDIVDALINASKEVDSILLASDDDREGEAIAWHLASRLEDVGKPMKRMVFNEIKKDKILKAIKSARDIDENRFHSQEARRILDRLVGFMASPYLMQFFGSNLSAGRVQSVVTRIVIDREREIEQFKPEDFWTVQTKLTDGTTPFVAKFPGKIEDLQTANSVKAALASTDYIISNVTSAEEKKYPPPPLMTITLQRIMSKDHGMDPEKTMKAAQSLYESGCCTYIRTDSVRIGDDALNGLRTWLTDNKHELPLKAHSHENKGTSQDAHECIRPSDINLIPNNNYEIIDSDEKLVYETIWKYFVASQMVPAVFDTLTVMAHPTNDATFKVKATGKALKSKGYLDILGINDPGSIDIPNLTKGQIIKLENNGLKLDKKQTQPPPRFSVDKLMDVLEKKKIGRPATYADLLSKITARNYVEKKGNVYHATDLGKRITDELTKCFGFMDYNYTSAMEKQLDDIESGKINHIDMLKKFYPEFKKELDSAYVARGSTLCDRCGSAMSARKTKNGETFLGCSNFPKCKNTISK